MIITIDGPTASGKSSAARALAMRLECCHLNSGLLYRALAYLLIEHAQYSLVTLSKPKKEDVDKYLDQNRLRYHCAQGGHGGVSFDGHDITSMLKGNEIGQGASLVSLDGHVRSVLLTVQRAIGTTYNCVVDGRDSGSVVFPGAQVKFFLTASLAVRAARWQADQLNRGNRFTIEQARQEVTLRDERDEQRAVAPLTIPQGAVVIDNSDLSHDQTVEVMLQVIHARIK